MRCGRVGWWLGWSVGLSVLAACGGTRSVETPVLVDEAADSAWVGEPDFRWHLSGDRRVAPQQVFSGVGRIWVQWHPHQTPPTILAQSEGPWRVVSHRQHGQYTVIEGVWPRLRFQGGKLAAYATHHNDAADRQTCFDALSAVESSGQRSRFQINTSDRTIRQALNRWATEHHWYFDDAHWALPYDLPVTAPATFEGDFMSAVAQLLAAADIAGQPVRACFYANHVLRVIPGAQSCDPGGVKGDK